MKDHTALFKRIAKATGTRLATCGACGSERQVTQFMRRNPDMQYQARPDQETDAYYCRCQDQDW